MDNTSYSSVGFRDRPYAEALRAIAEAGWSQTEISGQEPHVASVPVAGELAEFRTIVDAIGVTVRSVHAPAMRHVLGTTTEEWRREVIPVLKSYIRFTGAIGADHIVIHPIPNPMFVPDPDDPAVPRLVADGIRASLEEVVPVAQESGVRVLLENLPYLVDYPYRSMKELRELVDSYPAESLGLVIDTGHVGILGLDPGDEIRAAGDRLFGTHIHDVIENDGLVDHHAPTRGIFDWDAVLQAFSDIDYRGVWNFEVILPGDDESQEELARFTRDIAASWGLVEG